MKLAAPPASLAVRLIENGILSLILLAIIMPGFVHGVLELLGAAIVGVTDFAYSSVDKTCTNSSTSSQG